MSRDYGDLSGDIDLLQYTLDCARREIERLRGELRGDVVKFCGGGERPTRDYEGDAGFDLYTEGNWVIGPSEFVDIPCGISVELPEGVWAMIVGRSSTLRKRGLLVMPGIIDNGWRGELFAGVQNLSQEQEVKVSDGERVAQLIPYPLVASRLEWQRVSKLGESDRGARGFGSTGS